MIVQTDFAGEGIYYKSRHYIVGSACGTDSYLTNSFGGIELDIHKTEIIELEDGKGNSSYKLRLYINEIHNRSNGALEKEKIW